VKVTVKDISAWRLLWRILLRGGYCEGYFCVKVTVKDTYLQQYGYVKDTSAWMLLWRIFYLQREGHCEGYLSSAWWSLWRILIFSVKAIMKDNYLQREGYYEEYLSSACQWLHFRNFNPHHHHKYVYNQTFAEHFGVPN
jgi:hypothetical protein